MDQPNAMQDDVLVETNEEFEAPTIGHVTLVFEALNDTVKGVAGTEGLTSAQIYFHGVLSASGGITYAESIKGAEGFFANVKAGASKAIEYIKKMFKDIWGYFFKKKAPEEIKDLKEGIKSQKDELENLEKLKSHLARAVSESKEIMTEVNKASSMSDLITASKEVAKANTKAQQALAVKIANLVESLQAEIKLAGEVETQAKASGEGDYVAWASGVKASVSGTQALVNSIKDIRDLADVKAATDVLDHLKTYIDVMERSLQSAAGTEPRVQGRIDALSMLDGNSNASDEQKKEGDKNLAALQLFMKSAARHSGLLKRTISHMKAVNAAVGKVFGA